MNIDEVNALRGPGIPTARNVDHFAVTVPDLEAACRFFVSRLGALLLYREGPISGGAWMRENLRVDPAASCTVALLRLGPTCNLELFEYSAPDQTPEPPRNSDVGGHHLAFRVDDIDAAHAYLRTVEGVAVQGEPKLITDGPIAGSRWFYFTTPWGLQLEVTSPASQMPYEAGTPFRRYLPHEGSWADGGGP